MEGLSDDPLWPALVEIINRPEADGIILAGGFGLRLKQYYVHERNSVTLLNVLPEVRATLDLDVFLNVNIWVDIEKAHALSSVLQNSLNYKTHTHSWQLRKPLADSQNRFVKLDLMARPPLDTEPVKVKDNPKQVGRRMGTGIAGRCTPEAFAIDDSPLMLKIGVLGQEYSILVPHPYASLNMKIRAAHDWLLERQGRIEPKLTDDGDSKRLKHVYDVYVLIAMLTQEERIEAAALAVKYRDHEEARKTRDQAFELYGSKGSEGIQAIEGYSRRYMRMDLQIDHELFWDEGLRIALGIA